MAIPLFTRNQIGNQNSSPPQEDERQQGLLANTLGRLHLAPAIWAIVLSLLATLLYVVVQNPQFPRPSGATLAATWLTFGLALAGLYFLFRTTAADPGYLPRAAHRAGASPWTKGNSGGGASSSRLVDGESSELHGQGSRCCDLDNPALRAGQWGQVCVSCRIVRPLRAKHCPMSGRCVEGFDHFCPVGSATAAATVAASAAASAFGLGCC